MSEKRKKWNWGKVLFIVVLLYVPCYAVLSLTQNRKGRTYDTPATFMSVSVYEDTLTGSYVTCAGDSMIVLWLDRDKQNDPEKRYGMSVASPSPEREKPQFSLTFGEKETPVDVEYIYLVRQGEIVRKLPFTDELRTVAMSDLETKKDEKTPILERILEPYREEYFPTIPTEK